MKLMIIRLAAALAAVASLAACGGPDPVAEREEMRAPANVQQKTAEILELADASNVTVTDIHMRDADSTGVQVVEWSAKTPEGDYSCNSDAQMAHPVCDQVRVASGQPSAVELAAEQAAVASFSNSAEAGTLEDVIPPEP